jgi:hypothetical protein
MSKISPQQEEGFSKKRKKREQRLKRKRGETSVEKLRVLRREKKKRMRSINYWEIFY